MSVNLTKLPSGLTVVTDTMPHLETAALGVWAGPLPWGGSAEEPELVIWDHDGYESLGAELGLGPDFDGDGLEDLYVWSLTSPLVDGSPGVISVLPSGRLW